MPNKSASMGFFPTAAENVTQCGRGRFEKLNVSDPFGHYHAWRDLLIRRPGDSDWCLADDLRRRMAK